MKKGNLNTKLLLFDRLYEDPIFAGMCNLYEDNFNSHTLRSAVLHRCVARILQWGEEYGFSGNLPVRYIAWLLAMNTNPLSLCAERHQHPGESLSAVGLHDLGCLMEFIVHPWEKEMALDGRRPFTLVGDYKPSEKRRPYNPELVSAVEKLSDAFLNQNGKRETSAYNELLDFYSCFGVGHFFLYHAFRWKEGEGLAPVLHTHAASLADLIGYEFQKEELIQNTEAFLAGRPANNVLLYGDSGTGKTTSVKALLHDYHSVGLRMIEVNRQQISCIPEVVDTIRDRNYYFIIFLDDLSFEDFETEYKYLKMIIDGGIEEKPSNILIYATSNRRHLVNESWKDREKQQGDVHHKDTLHEKLSLSDRFGINLSFYSTSKDEFLGMVVELAQRRSLAISQERLYQEAIRWEMRHPGFCGRNAKQFIDALEAEISK